MGSLDGRVAVVTGATRGIGLAIAERLLSDGAKIIATGRAGEARGPAGSRYMAVDFDDTDAVENLARSLADLKPDILINNAGINKVSPFAAIDPADFDRIHRVNLAVPFRLCQAVLPGMRSKGWGRIVSISSIWGKVSRAGRASYSASKFGLDGMTAALSAEVAGDGVLVNCVAPGFTDTELTRRVLSEADIEAILAQVPARRLARPEEIASFVAWLAGSENTYISGQNIAIDGGFTRV
jgi:NAD(P)-dependent dehydrogenase (short-subunit alcohol dehydrogenase family)